MFWIVFATAFVAATSIGAVVVDEQIPRVMFGVSIVMATIVLAHLVTEQFLSPDRQ
jgi:bacteriorhodopsin